MQFDEIVAVRKSNAAWRLLRADNAPLLLSFLGRVFVDDNVREISESALVNLLDDELYSLNKRLGEGTYPRSPKAYLDEWSAPDTGWLRKYYVIESDEPHYDATPAVERAVAWVRSLRDRGFVGTESRLKTVLELLRQIVYGTTTDSERRLADLHRRRAEIDAEIEAAERGEFQVLDETSRRDRYQQFADIARALLSDFREVESNFRTLDREMRERIATWRGTKGELLDEIVGSRNIISDSDQGRSFQAFYDLLLSADRLDELDDLVRHAQSLDDVADSDLRLTNIHHDWLDAGTRAQGTVRRLSEQLRRFLDDQAWLENRRVMDLLRSIESTAYQVRDRRVDDFAHEIDSPTPSVHLPLERPLYRPTTSVEVASDGIEEGEAQGASEALFEQIHVDPAPLIDSVRHVLRRRDQITLAEVVAERPIEQGLAELITYLSLTDESFTKVFDEQAHESVSWVDDAGAQRTARVPRVIYTRPGSPQTTTAAPTPATTDEEN
ncbi:DUF3375 domain-containing protein [Gordonia neofelifaecis]|uniref:DUF3375 domain-containing protein n=1 Tax=Gordonia neofelifaecis NRRL B-59395 TaxID=644548 RepID=F1YE15_9ACTN|nr:DUF3375 domain-containing protein [Gordonia neofelifaecis]EGD57105.1 hypothetical protein SCNU_01985 [Gordonia neofelifaecis NRRL B-59395]